MLSADDAVLVRAPNPSPVQGCCRHTEVEMAAPCEEGHLPRRDDAEPDHPNKRISAALIGGDGKRREDEATRAG